MQQGEYAKALPELEMAAKLAPSNPQIHLYLEQVYSRLGRSAEAKQEKAEFVRLHSAQQSSASNESDKP
jgi:Flp pilus assembly protein TadD